MSPQRRDDGYTGIRTGRAPEGQQFDPDFHCVWSDDVTGATCPYLNHCTSVCEDIAVVEGEL